MKDFFHKKALHGGTNFFGKIFWGMLLMIMQEGKLMVKRFQRSSQVNFYTALLDLGL